MMSDLFNFSEPLEFAYVVMEVIGRPKHIAEIGTFNPDHLQVMPFIMDRECRIELFEPQPVCVMNLRKSLGKCLNVEIHEIAIGSDYGQADLCIPVPRPSCPNAGSSAFLEGITSPYSARADSGRPEEMEHVRVEVAPLSEFDNGTIQAMHVDTEGNEWPVLQGMISRPKVISLEMRGQCHYRNPYTVQIENWMKDNGYTEHLVGKTDTVYVRKI